MAKNKLAICAAAALGLCLMGPKVASAFPAAAGQGPVYNGSAAVKSEATPVRWGGWGWRGAGWRGGWGWRGVGWRGGWGGYGGWGWPVGLGLGLATTGWGWGGGWGYPYSGGWGGWGSPVGYGLGWGYPNYGCGC